MDTPTNNGPDNTFQPQQEQTQHSEPQTHSNTTTVQMGTCGWTYDMYPPKGCSTVTAKLQYLSKLLPSVEVNTSTYAIPHPTTTSGWVKDTVDGFKFHFKAYGLFCSRGITVSNLPQVVRTSLPPHQQAASFLHLHEMPPSAVDETWSLFHACLEPVYQAGKLGVVLFQMHLNFLPSDANLEYILQCRTQRLDARFSMAVELRCRQWFTNPVWRQRVHEAFSRHGIALVSADELEHETYQKDNDQRGLPAGAVRRVLPIATLVTTSEFAYARIHRRHGTVERLLSDEELTSWVERIEAMAKQLQGPMYIMWGTDWKDACLKNGRALEERLPEEFRCGWKPFVKQKGGGLIAKMFSKAAAVESEKKKRVSDTIAIDSIETQEGAEEDMVLAKKKAKKEGIAAFFKPVDEKR